MSPVTTPPPLPIAVLDTNAVLDAWLFEDDGMLGVLSALSERRIVWVATQSMREELVHTLLLPALKTWSARADATLACFDGNAQICAEPARTPHRPLWCSDNDDQVFMDLALAQHARWLLTKDRALLRLGRRARPFGVLIMQPARWRPAELDAASADR